MIRTKAVGNKNTFYVQ